MNKLVKNDSLHVAEEDAAAAPPPMHVENEPPLIITEDAARQGPLGIPVLVMLLGGMALIFIGMFVALMLSGSPPPAH